MGRFQGGDTSTADESLIQSEDATQNPDFELSVTDSAKVLASASSILQAQANQVLPLDLAILKSVESCPSEELRKKVLNAVLIVGKGLKFAGASDYLKQRLTLQVPLAYKSDNLDVITNAKELPSEITTWKGAAIMSTLQSAQELWINGKEWSKSGQKLLREKAPFPWT